MSSRRASLASVISLSAFVSKDASPESDELELELEDELPLDELLLVEDFDEEDELELELELDDPEPPLVSDAGTNGNISSSV